MRSTRPIITTARAIQLAADQGDIVRNAAEAHLVGAITESELRHLNIIELRRLALKG